MKDSEIREVIAIWGPVTPECERIVLENVGQMKEGEIENIEGVVNKMITEIYKEGRQYPR